MPGVDSGEIGPKFGYNSKDNGWMTLKDVRIPRDQMLSKYSGIDREGNFVVKGNTKVLYAAMLFTRILIISGAPFCLSQALTICLRYSVCRRQFKTVKGSKLERKLLDY
jgi:acyl-CoA oxidase